LIRIGGGSSSRSRRAATANQVTSGTVLGRSKPHRAIVDDRKCDEHQAAVISVQAVNAFHLVAGLAVYCSARDTTAALATGVWAASKGKLSSLLIGRGADGVFCRRMMFDS